MSPLDMAVVGLFEAMQPPPGLTVSEWADTYRRLSREASAEPGDWRTDRAPYQREIMDSMGDRSVNTVVIMSSAQIGKSELLNNVIGYHIHQDPSPMLLLQPTLEMAEAFSKDRIAPMLRDSPALAGKVKDPRARDSGNTLLQKIFPGGHLTMCGANSPASLASRPIRVVLCDEVDRYPESAGTEGDPVNLAKKRTATFWNRKVMLTSTPTIKNLSRIETAYNASDQRKYWVPCPDCGEYQVLKWANIKWDEGKPDTARYACEHCGVLIEHSAKTEMLRLGQWRADAPFKGVAGFHLSELYSPWRKWADVAHDFLEAKHGGTEMLKTWVNTSLGEPWEDQGDSVEAGSLMARLEDYEIDDLQPLAITAGADVQKDRIECSVIAWGPKEESWVLEHAILPGDTARPEVWQDLHDFLTEHEPNAVAIDSGFNASQVYAFVERRRFAFAVKGVSGFDKPLVEDDRKRARRMRTRRKAGGSPVVLVGVDQAKVIIHSRLRIVSPGPGYIHFSPDAGCDEEYFAQLAAEKLIVKHRLGRATQEWHQTRPRNEALDAMVYALAALRLWGALPKAEARSQKPAEDDSTVQEVPDTTDDLPFDVANVKKIQQRRARRQGGFVGRW